MLSEISDGSRTVVDKLMPVVYDELRNLAQIHLRRERGGHTLNPTALAHEAYLKLIDQKSVTWQNRAHFFGIASQAMRRILINYANQKLAQKRGGGATLITYDEQNHPRETAAEDIVRLDEALSELARLNERQAKVVELRFFGGLTHEEISEVLAVSVPTVRRDWRLARAWMSRELGRP